MIQPNIPEGTIRVVVRGRHAKSVQDGTNETRTLKESGVELCMAVRDEYQKLIDYLIAIFGPPAYASSMWPRSLITNFLITGSEQISQDSRLTLKISVKKAPSPKPEFGNYYDWAKAQKMTIPDILKALVANPSLFGNQPVDDALFDNEDFIQSFSPENNLVVTFDHEPVISYTAAKYGASEDDIGLGECQAFIFYLNAKRKIIGVEKFVPAATVKEKVIPAGQKTSTTDEPESDIFASPANAKH